MSASTNNNESFNSVWLRPTRTPRNERPTLSQARIVQAAVELLDAQGLDGLSLRRLAEHLESGVTSLYWYVNTKDDLLELVIDAILEDAVHPIEATDDWKADLRVLAGRLRTTILRHPWSASLFGSFLGLGPNALAYAEVVLTVLGRTGLTGDLLNGAMSGIFHYVIGSAVTDAAWLTTMNRAGLKENSWANILEGNIQHAVESHSPQVARYLTGFGADDVEKRFALGLEAILEGVERWVGGETENLQQVVRPS